MGCGRRRGTEQITAPLFFYVPRSIWTSKPDDTGDTIHDAVGYPIRMNQSSPLWVELYVVGGFAIVFAGMTLYGALSRFVGAGRSSVASWYGE